MRFPYRPVANTPEVRALVKGLTNAGIAGAITEVAQSNKAFRFRYQGDLMFYEFYYRVELFNGRASVILRIPSKPKSQTLISIHQVINLKE